MLSTPTKQSSVLGIPIHTLAMADIVDTAIQLVDQHMKGDPANYLATLNADFCANSHGWLPESKAPHPELLDTLRRATLVTADGMPICWLSRALGGGNTTRVSGADLVPALACAAADKGISFYFLGGDLETTRRALEVLPQQLKAVGIHSPVVQPGSEPHPDDGAIIEAINAASPDVLLLSLGNPKQELFFRRIQKHLAVPLTIGIGGTLKFLAGEQARAPDAVQRLGLEWLFRLCQEPRRLWRRYLVDITKLSVLTIPLLITDALATLSKPLSQSEQTTLQQSELVLPQVIDSTCAGGIREKMQDLLQDSPSTVRINMNKTRYLDASGVAVLLESIRLSEQKNSTIQFTGIKPWPRRLLRWHRAWDAMAPLVQES